MLGSMSAGAGVRVRGTWIQEFVKFQNMGIRVGDTTNIKILKILYMEDLIYILTMC